MVRLIEETEEVFLSAFNYAAIGMALVAPDGTWLKVNNALCSIVGYSQQELLSKTFQDITHPDDLNEDLRLVHQLLDGEIDTYQMEKRYFHRDGRVIHILLSVSLVRRPDGTPRFFVSQIQDVTRQKALEEELARLAREDELTKVFNRRYFREFATREVIRGGRFREPQALLMIDIDHFKRINDTYGHDIGDVVLCAMARECGRSLRSVDVFGRLGGEEFAALLLSTDLEIARMLAERLRKRIEDLVVEAAGHSIRFTVSIGLVAFTETNLSLDALLKKADEALYEAKDTGRNKVVVRSVAPESDGEPPETLRTSFIRLEWNRDYASGCKTIDRQHHNLFLLTNDLLAAIISGMPDDQVDAVARELVKDMAAHFRDEDGIYRKAGYPGADTHGRIHSALLRDMQSILERFKRKEASVADLFHHLAIKVVKNHLIDEDRKFFPYLGQEDPC